MTLSYITIASFLVLVYCIQHDPFKLSITSKFPPLVEFRKQDSVQYFTNLYISWCPLSTLKNCWAKASFNRTWIF